MPIKIGQFIPAPEQATADLIPDIKTDVTVDFPATFSAEMLMQFPGKVVNGKIILDFSNFTPEQKQLFADQYRFQGMRMRHDIKDRTIPLTKQTLDVP